MKNQPSICLFKLLNLVTFSDCRRHSVSFLCSRAQACGPSLLNYSAHTSTPTAIPQQPSAGWSSHLLQHPSLPNPSSSAFLLTLFRAAWLMNYSVIHPMLIRGWRKNTLLKTLNSIKTQHYRVPPVCIKPPIWNQRESSWIVMNNIQLLNQ